MANVVVIPIYKSELNSNEIISLQQCYKILGDHPVFFVAPKTLNIAFYENILNQKIKTERFDDIFFQNISGYNQLMLSTAFYERFSTYEYMLIYQLDCYVFNNELDFWSQKGYDYIGAPWLDNFYYRKSKVEKLKFLIARFIQNNLNKENKYKNKNILTYKVGNGGFSLRKINTFLRVLQKTDKEIINKFTKSDDPKSVFNEDIFWSFVANIKKPDYKIAAKFALDLGAEIGIKLNQGELPFGCHAWDKKYFFWEKYINV